jgi:cysteine synthase
MNSKERNERNLSRFRDHFDQTHQSLSQVEELVGNTPLLAVHFKFKGEKRVVFAKAEHLNLSGSIKDRMALHILRNAYANGSIKRGDTIVEATSGNTGIAFAALGRAFRHPVLIYMPNWMSGERVALIKSYGAEVELVSKEQGGFLGSIHFAEEFEHDHRNTFLPSQFSNPSNTEAHYLTTGPEIWNQLQRVALNPDAFVAGVGTGGTMMGAGKFLREKNPQIKLFPLEPAESPTLTTGHKVGSHRIQGISDEFIPSIVHLDELDEVITASDGDSIITAQMLASELGLAVGISSGANLIGAIKAQEILGNDTVVVTIFCDDNKKYLSTGLTKHEPLKSEYLSQHIEFLGYEAIARLPKPACFSRPAFD